MASIGVVKSERISQLTGRTLYFPVAAISLASLKVGEIFILCTSMSWGLDIKKRP